MNQLCAYIPIYNTYIAYIYMYVYTVYTHTHTFEIF